MSNPRSIKLEKLFINNAARSRTTAEVTISAPTRSGRPQQLIVIIDTTRALPGYRTLVDAIIDEAVSFFNEAHEETPEATLEVVLEALNASVPDLLEAKRGLAVDDLNILVGISEHGQIHFSYIGDVSALLINEASISEVTEGLSDAKIVKLFSHITSGLLNPGDALILTTRPLIDYVAEDKLKQLMTAYPPEIVVQRLESLLAQVPDFVSFSAVFMKFTTDRDEIAVGRMRATQPAELFEPVETTSDKAHGNTTVDDDRELQPVKLSDVHRTIRRRGDRRRGDAVLRMIGRSLVQYLVILGAIGRSLARGVSEGVQAILFRTKRLNQEARFVTWSGEQYRSAVATLGRLPKPTRVSLVTLAALVLILLHILIVQSLDQRIQRSLTAYDETLLAVSLKRGDAANAAIYEDDASAERIFLEIDAMLKSLNPRNKEQEDQIAKLIDENARDLNKVRRINYIASPLVFATIETPTGDSPRAISAVGDDIYVGAGTAVYRVREDGVQTVDEVDGAITALSKTEILYALTDSGEVYRLTDGQLRAVTVAQTDETAAADARTVYAQNLYTLNRESGAIYRQAGTATALTAPAIWMQDGSLVSGAHDIAIDGNVYLMMDDGTVVKLLRGERQSFSIRTPSPSIGESSSLYTLPDGSYLYILDPDNQRILIFDKENGSIKDQFTSPAFDNLLDISIDQNESAISVLNGDTIYLVAINK